jgi:uncharacterized protein YndB with AHSA1/START domain
MAIIEIVREIERPAHEVFEYLCDVKSWPQWSPSLTKAELVSGGTWAVGAKLRGAFRTMGRTIEWTATVTEFEPDRLCGFATVMAMGTMAERYTFEPVAGGTRLNTKIDLRGKGIYRLLMPLANRSFKKQWTEDGLRLKRILESSKLQAK